MKTEGCVVWIPSLSYLVERYKSSQFMKFVRELKGCGQERPLSFFAIFGSVQK